MYDILPVLAEWDLVNAINSTSNYGKLVGAGLFTLFGVAGLIVFGYQLFVKVFGSDQSKQKYSWPVIVIGILVAGAFLYGGWSLFDSFASGGSKTIQDMGGSVITLALAR